jgi:hypothetical protein
VLRRPGLALFRAIQFGTFDRSLSIEPVPAGFDCYFCDAPVEAGYEDGSFRLACPGCDHLYSVTMLPPSAVEGADQAELLARVDQYNRQRMQLATRGVCPVCVNGMEPSFVPAAEVWSEGSERLGAFVRSSTRTSRSSRRTGTEPSAAPGLLRPALRAGRRSA